MITFGYGNHINFISFKPCVFHLMVISEQNPGYWWSGLKFPKLSVELYTAKIYYRSSAGRQAADKTDHC